MNVMNIMGLSTMTLFEAALWQYAAAAGLFGLGAYLRRPGLSRALHLVFLSALATLVGALVVRYHEVQHAPFQTLFEVLMYAAVMGSLSYLVIYVSKKLYRLDGGRLVWANIFGLAVSGAICGVLLYASTSDSFRNELPPALQSVYFIPHVTVYFFAYGTMIVAACSALVYLALHYSGKMAILGGFDLDRFTYAIIGVGFPFLSTGLSLGAIWAYYAWANWWGWDSKEVWALISWLAYLVYLHLRMTAGWRGVRAAWYVVGAGAVILTTFLMFGHFPASFTSLHKYTD